MAVKPQATPSNMGGIYLSVPFDAGFVGTLKANIDYAQREWQAEQKRWYISAMAAKEALRIAQKYWPELDVSELRPDGQDEGPTSGPFGDNPFESIFEQFFGTGARTHQHQRAQAGEPFRQRPAGQQQRQAPPPPSAPAASGLAANFATLHLAITAPPEVVRAAYKALAVKHHPDKGGSIVVMQAVNAAMDALKKAGKA
jgi:hypothetical protein